MEAHNTGLTRTADPTQCIAALRALFERAAEVAVKLSAIAGAALDAEALDVAGRRALLPGLTPRESEVLDLVLDGLSSKEIARRLGISGATARCHVQNILTKLGVFSRAQAAALATESAPTRTRGSPGRSAAAAKLAVLTPRETEVLRALAGGMAKREIAEQLVLSPHTVRTHIQRVLAKLGVHSVLGAMAVARRAGVPPLRPT